MIMKKIANSIPTCLRRRRKRSDCFFTEVVLNSKDASLAGGQAPGDLVGHPLVHPGQIVGAVQEVRHLRAVAAGSKFAALVAVSDPDGHAAAETPLHVPDQTPGQVVRSFVLAPGALTCQKVRTQVQVCQLGKLYLC